MDFKKVQKIATSIGREYRSLRLTQKILAPLHMIFLVPLTLYFADDHANPLAQLDFQTAPTITPELVSSADKSINNGLTESLAQVNWIYKIPSLVFAICLKMHNKLAHITFRNSRFLNVWNVYYDRFISDLSDPRFIKSLALDVRPIVLTGSLFVFPLHLLLMVARQMMLVPAIAGITDNSPPGGLRFRQKIDNSQDPREQNFFDSPVFTPVILAPLLLGIPAVISSWIYCHLGVDRLLGYEMNFATATIYFYIYGVGAALTVLFCKAYFTLVCNFCSQEFEIEVYPDMIRALPMKGWFIDFISSRNLHSPTQIRWQNVTSITTSNLPGVQHHSQILKIASPNRSLSVRLFELNATEKVDLFKCIRENAPSIYIEESVQLALIGSAIMREPQFTDIWFNILNNQAATRPGELPPHITLQHGRYEIQRKLASGGQGIAFLASREDGQKVVLKEFLLMSGESLSVLVESAKDFESESSILSQLNHDGIVKYIEMFHEDGRLYIVMEFVEGQTLRDIVKARGPFSEQEILNFGEQLCEILSYLHNQQPAIVHRDFTPENIMLQASGKLKLIDFSVAQNANDNRHHCAGKHAYTPPEQFRGEAVPQSDLYALGATMFFLSTGTDPEPLMKSMLPTINSPLRKKIDEIIQAATELDVARRCESAQWLKMLLKSPG